MQGIVVSRTKEVGVLEENRNSVNRNTIKFEVPAEGSEVMKATLTQVYRSLTEKGYNPINQIVGYILSEDPTYITNHNNARSLICKLDRDELLQELVRHYLFDRGSAAQPPGGEEVLLPPFLWNLPVSTSIFAFPFPSVLSQIVTIPR